MRSKQVFYHKKRFVKEMLQIGNGEKKVFLKSGFNMLLVVVCLFSFEICGKNFDVKLLNRRYLKNM